MKYVMKQQEIHIKYVSRAGISQTYEQWKEDAISFYNNSYRGREWSEGYTAMYRHSNHLESLHPNTYMPSDWWERWQKVLRIQPEGE